MQLLSKLLNLLAQPLNWVLALLLLSVLLQRLRPRHAAKAVLGATGLLALLGFQTLPDALLSRLEGQYPELHSDGTSDADLKKFAGVVVLGGALESGRISAHHRQPLLNDSAERMTAAVALWQRRPALRLVFSGGEGEWLGSGPTEAERASRFFSTLGLPVAAVTLESRSRNTYENAVFTGQLPGVDIKQPWLLLTSAWHMPRSMATFEKAGWNVTAYPVDFRTGGSTPWSRYDLRSGADHWELLLHETLGLAAYRISGRL
jgi:uncharacterized SAM-binding protein YcdF (DUF218 family)